MNITEELEAAKAQAKAARDEVSALKSQLTERDAKISAHAEQLAAKDSEIATLKSQATEAATKHAADIKAATELTEAADKRATEAEAKAKEFEAKVPGLASNRAQNILAATGHPPVEMATNGNPSNQNQEADISQLKGSAKVKAVFQKQLEALRG